MASSTEQTAQQIEASELTIVVDAEEYEEALNDISLRKLNDRADAFLRGAELEGRDF